MGECFEKYHSNKVLIEWKAIIIYSDFHRGLELVELFSMLMSSKYFESGLNMI